MHTKANPTHQAVLDTTLAHGGHERLDRRPGEPLLEHLSDELERHSCTKHNVKHEHFRVRDV